jgi:hypothetical protein
VTSRQLIRWQLRHERRARAWWASPWVIALAAGAGLAAFVAWRGAAAGPVAADHAWLAGAVAAFALALLRVPFHVYWRADAALLAQLPIDGGALLDAALVRCARAAVTTLVAVLIAAAPLADASLVGRAALVAGALALSAAGLLPAVAVGAATLVSADGARAIARVAGAAPGDAPPASPAAMLGALPGFAATAVLVVALLAAPWLHGAHAAANPPALLGVLAGASVLALVLARTGGAARMPQVLREVSALDRQRLATLEIRPPTALERGIAALLGDAGLPYRKDARLVRRRYPAAFALGALAFGVLVITGLARPRDPAPWLGGTLLAAALYAVSLARRLHRPPIELPRLARTLPIAAGARARAKVAWLAGWWCVFVIVPSVFAIARTGAGGLAVALAAATVIVLAAAAAAP